MNIITIGNKIQAWVENNIEVGFKDGNRVWTGLSSLKQCASAGYCEHCNEFPALNQDKELSEHSEDRMLSWTLLYALRELGQNYKINYDITNQMFYKKRISAFMMFVRHYAMCVLYVLVRG